MVVHAEMSTTFCCDTSDRHEAVSIKMKHCGGKKKKVPQALWVCVINFMRINPVLFELNSLG